jgi:hypothetical protein
MPPNEIGSAPERARPVVGRETAEAQLSQVAEHPINLPERVVVTSAPQTCPACGAQTVVWGCDPSVDRPLTEIHPAVWSEHELMADSFICTTCDAGWIEPDQPAAITWVRPYWTDPD